MDKLDKKKIWHEVLESIKVSVSSANFQTWFKQTHIVNIKKVNKRYLVEIGCGSSYAKNTMETRYQSLVQESLTNALSNPCDLIFSVSQRSKTIDASDTPLFEEASQKGTELKTNLRNSRIRPGFTFDNYAVSSTNQMAWAAADAVSNSPGAAYNPLFIWGGVGVGKTHLMNSVGYKILRDDPNAKVYLCSSEEFTNDIVEGIRNKSTQSFRNKYRKLDALLIDDIQFIAGKDTVQEEFFHTFNTLTASGSQIILTSDQIPSRISRLEERLKSRFEAGLIVDVGSPDFELRCAITQIKASERQLEIPNDLVQLIAANLDTARAIEGFIVKLSSEIFIKKTELSEETITNLLGKGSIPQDNKIKAQPSEFVVAVTKYYSVGKRNLMGASRARPISMPRQVLMYLLRTELQLPLQEVGRLVGGRDHTTVMHAVGKITQLAKADVDIRQDIAGIKKMI